MPLPSVKFANKYQVMMFTFGPRHPDSTREQFENVLKDAYGKFTNAKIAFEDSADGYNHVHIGVQLPDAQKPSKKLIAKFKSMCDPKQERKPNLGCHHVPQNSKKPAWQVIDEYLSDPKKIKTCDDGSLDLARHDDGMEFLLELCQRISTRNRAARLGQPWVDPWARTFRHISSNRVPVEMVG